MRTYQEIVRDGYTLRGMLHRPAGIEKIPMVVMLHGFGGNKLEKHRMFMEMSEMLAEKGIATNVHYKSLPMFTAYKNIGFDVKDYPNAYEMYKNEVTLPLHTLLTNEEVEYIIKTYRELLHS